MGLCIIKTVWTPDVTVSEFTLYAYDIGNLEKIATNTIKFIYFFLM